MKKLAFDGACVAMILFMPLEPQTPRSYESMHGYFSQYGELPSKATIAVRQDWGHIPEDISNYPVRLAVSDCGLIGATGWAKMDDGQLERMIVFDCSGHPHTSKWMKDNNIIGEVDYDTAVRWGIEGRGGILGSVYIEN